jgi:hypothetical protein
MTNPLATAHGDQGPREQATSYAGLFVRAERVSVLEHLAQFRFSGWVGPQEGAWVLSVARVGPGPVAGNGRDLPVLAAELAQGLSTVSLAAQVWRDQVLQLSGWHAASPLGSYVSDPSALAGTDDELAEPDGAWLAPTFASACGRPEAGEELAELLGEVIDHDSVSESERLVQALRLLGLPIWLVAAASLPGDVPGGPLRGTLTQLGAGHTGLGGRLGGLIAGLVRRGR